MATKKSGASFWHTFETKSQNYKELGFFRRKSAQKITYKAKFGNKVQLRIPHSIKPSSYFVLFSTTIYDTPSLHISPFLRTNTQILPLLCFVQLSLFKQSHPPFSSFQSDFTLMFSYKGWQHRVACSKLHR